MLHWELGTGTVIFKHTSTLNEEKKETLLFSKTWKDFFSSNFSTGSEAFVKIITRPTYYLLFQILESSKSNYNILSATTIHTYINYLKYLFFKAAETSFYNLANEIYTVQNFRGFNVKSTREMKSIWEFAEGFFTKF